MIYSNSFICENPFNQCIRVLSLFTFFDFKCSLARQIPPASGWQHQSANAPSWTNAQHPAVLPSDSEASAGIGFALVFIGAAVKEIQSTQTNIINYNQSNTNLPPSNVKRFNLPPFNNITIQPFTNQQSNVEPFNPSYSKQNFKPSSRNKWGSYSSTSA